MMYLCFLSRNKTQCLNNASYVSVLLHLPSFDCSLYLGTLPCMHCAGGDQN
jgi:hypothetical protein